MYMYFLSIIDICQSAESLHLDKNVWGQVFTSISKQCTCQDHLWHWPLGVRTWNITLISHCFEWPQPFTHMNLNNSKISNMYYINWYWFIEPWPLEVSIWYLTLHCFISVTLNSDIVFCNPNNWRSVLGNSHLFDLVFSDPYLLRLVQMPVGSPSDSPPLPSAFPSPCWAPTGGHGGQ